jgi:hypothetical protein
VTEAACEAVPSGACLAPYCILCDQCSCPKLCTVPFLRFFFPETVSVGKIGLTRPSNLVKKRNSRRTNGCLSWIFERQLENIRNSLYHHIIRHASWINAEYHRSARNPSRYSIVARRYVSCFAYLSDTDFIEGIKIFLRTLKVELHRESMLAQVTSKKAAHVPARVGTTRRFRF